MANSNRTGNGGGGSNQPPTNGTTPPPGGFRGRRVTTCSFCGKSSRDVGPMVEGPKDVYICANCVELCHNIIRQEKRKLSPSQPLFTTIPSPAPDQGIPRPVRHRPGPRQEGPLRGGAQPLQAARHARLRDRRRATAAENDVEIDKSNVLLIGPTG